MVSLIRKPLTLAWVCLTLFFVLFPLTLAKPGLPMLLKADEPANYLMAVSLWRDGDLRCDPQDIERLFHEFTPRTDNLFLMSEDGWKTVHFSAPLVYPLFAAPAAGLFGANGLIGVYNLMGGTRFIQNLMTGLPLEPLGIVVVMMAVLIVLGMFMDWIGVLLLTMPIFVPVIVALGFDPIWFGVIFCMNMQISYMTPPFGPAAFYLKGVAPPEISLHDIFNSLWPFIGLQAVGLTIVLLFPQIALWLPAAVFRN